MFQEVLYESDNIYEYISNKKSGNIDLLLREKSAIFLLAKAIKSLENQEENLAFLSFFIKKNTGIR